MQYANHLDDVLLHAVKDEVVTESRNPASADISQPGVIKPKERPLLRLFAEHPECHFYSIVQSQGVIETVLGNEPRRLINVSIGRRQNAECVRHGFKRLELTLLRSARFLSVA